MLNAVNVTIREARADDAEAFRTHMLRIHAEPGVDSPYSPEEYEASVEDEAARIEQFARSQNSLFLVAVSHDGRLVGSLRLLGGHLHAIHHTAELAIYIDQAYRRMGVGTRLMREAVEWARQTRIIKRISLEVYTRNKPAVQLYKKFGFKIEGHCQRAFYQNGRFLDEYIMALLL